MSNKNIKRKITHFTKVCKNIFMNASKEIFQSQKLDKVKKFAKEYKFVLIVAFIILFFIFKNVYTLGLYNHQIKALDQEIKSNQAINDQLKEDIEYYKTDEFILRYAVEELNLRPTKEHKLFHGEIKPVEEDSSSEETRDEEKDQDKETVSDTEDSSTSPIEGVDEEVNNDNNNQNE